jgi:hypothetical protein
LVAKHLGYGAAGIWAGAYLAAVLVMFKGDAKEE